MNLSSSTSAIGPLRTSEDRCARAARARPEGSTLPGLSCAALAVARVRCGARCARAAAMTPAPALNGPAHRAFSPARRWRAGLPLAALRCSPAQMRPVRALPSGLATALACLKPVCHPGCRKAVGGRARARICGAEQRSGARVCPPRSGGSARRLYGPPRPAAEPESSQPPSRSEQRRGLGPQGQARAATKRTGLPARSLARSVLASAQRTSNVRTGADSRPPRWILDLVHPS